LLCRRTTGERQRHRRRAWASCTSCPTSWGSRRPCPRRERVTERDQLPPQGLPFVLGAGIAVVPDVDESQTSMKKSICSSTDWNLSLTRPDSRIGVAHRLALVCIERTFGEGLQQPRVRQGYGAPETRILLVPLLGGPFGRRPCVG
jgi:hypothetical protein